MYCFRFSPLEQFRSKIKILILAKVRPSFVKALFSSPNHPPGNLDECQHLLYPYHRSCQFRYRNTIGIPRTVAISAMVIWYFLKSFLDFIDAIRIMIFGKTIMLLMLGYKKSLAKLSYTFTIPLSQDPSSSLKRYQ
jgi:hypothetical protein